MLVFYLVAPFGFILSLYSFYKIGHLIRSNPSSYLDTRQIRIEKISNVTLVIGFILQCLAIGISPFEYYQLFVKSVMPLTSFVFSFFSEFLMTLNKNTEIEPNIVLTNISYFSTPSALHLNSTIGHNERLAFK